MITKEDTREILALIGSKDCEIDIKVCSVDGHLIGIQQFTDSDKALEWVVDNYTDNDKFIITIT